MSNVTIVLFQDMDPVEIKKTSKSVQELAPVMQLYTKLIAKQKVCYIAYFGISH